MLPKKTGRLKFGGFLSLPLLAASNRVPMIDPRTDMEASRRNPYSISLEASPN